MGILGTFIRRREVTRPEAPGEPLEDRRRFVVVEESARAPEAPRRGDTPARPAQIQIASTGLRDDTSGRIMEGNYGLHVEIARISGRPQGRQAALAPRFNIQRPQIATYGAMYELPGGEIDAESQAVAGLIGV